MSCITRTSRSRECSSGVNSPLHDGAFSRAWTTGTLPERCWTVCWERLHRHSQMSTYSAFALFVDLTRDNNERQMKSGILGMASTLYVIGPLGASAIGAQDTLRADSSIMVCRAGALADIANAPLRTR